jgi:hypothetical protein
MIPGINLLNMALSIIGTQTVSYYQATGRTVNSVTKQYVTTYGSPITLEGSFQPVTRNLQQIYGLDLNKVYVIFYVSQELIDVQRNVSSDKVVFGAQTYICVQADGPWFKIDGWVGMLMVLNSGAPG